MAKQKTIPRTAREARRRRHKLIPQLTLETMSQAELKTGIFISTAGAEPDSLGWCGPCEPNGYRRCCYKDEMGRWQCYSAPC